MRRKGQEAGEEEKTDYRSKVNAEERQALRAAREKLSKMKGTRVAPSEVVGEMAKAFANGLFGAEAEKPEDEPKEEPKRARNYVSFQPCPICLDTFVPTAEGLLRTSVDAWLKAIAEGAEVVNATPEFFCACEGEKHRRDRCPNWKPREATWKKDRYTPAEWVRIVEARDGFVCRNPACRDELPLHGSHLKPHADGNPPTPENMRQHCAVCNMLIDEEKLRIVGFAPFERYYDAEGEFLGYGYDLEPRTEELDPHPGSSHVGRFRRTPPRGRKATRNGAAKPPGGS